MPEDVGDDGKFARIPDKFDLDLGNRLVFRFVRKFIPEHYDGVSAIFRRKGAYARFKDPLFDLGKLDAWYAFENSSRETSLRRWAEGEGFVVEPAAKTHTERVYQFRVELKDLEPRVWRRIQVPETYSFWDLHVAIQDAMGWLDYHLHVFRVVEKDRKSPVLIGIPDEFESPDARTLPGWETPVIDFFREVGSGPEYESKELVDWVGRDFDPDKFEPDDVRFDDPKVRWENAFRQ